jgi:hypothetical protein
VWGYLQKERPLLLLFQLYFTHFSEKVLVHGRMVETCAMVMLRQVLNPLTPKLNPSAQRCLTRFFLPGIFLLKSCISLNICVKNQQIHQLIIQFINYVW